MEAAIRSRHDAEQKIDEYRQDLGIQKDEYEIQVAKLEDDLELSRAELSQRDERITQLHRNVEHLRDQLDSTTGLDAVLQQKNEEM